MELVKISEQAEFERYMERLRLCGLEQLQKDGMYLEPWDEGDDDCMTQEQLQLLFDSTDWKDGVTAYYQDVIKYVDNLK